MSLTLKKIDNQVVADYLSVPLNDSVLFLTGQDVTTMLERERLAAASPSTAPRQSTTRSMTPPSAAADPVCENGRFKTALNMTAAEKRILNLLDHEKRAMSRSEIMPKAGLSEQTWAFAIKALRDGNFVRTLGNRRSAKYVITDSTEMAQVAPTGEIIDTKSETEIEEAIKMAEGVMKEIKEEDAEDEIEETDELEEVEEDMDDEEVGPGDDDDDEDEDEEMNGEMTESVEIVTTSSLLSDVEKSATNW